MWMRASGLRRGFTNHCENADSIDDIVGGGAGTATATATAAAIPFVSSLPGCGIIYDNPPLGDYVDNRPPYAVYDMWAQNGQGGLSSVVDSALGRRCRRDTGNGPDKGRAY
jgi:hypothetical protein